MGDSEAAWKAPTSPSAPAGRFGPAMHSPGRGTRLVSADGPHPGHGTPQTVTGEV